MPFAAAKILSALSTIVPVATQLFSSFRSSSAGDKASDRLDAIETELSRAGEVVSALATQLVALAGDVRKLEDSHAALQKRANLALVFSGIAMLIAITAVLLARK